jgi:o-succinylbenzoate synthase
MSEDRIVVTGCRLAPYDLEFVRPWRSAGGTHRRRRGWTLLLETGPGVTGVGECAPLPEAGTESTDEARAALSEWVGAVTGMELGMLWETLDEEPPPPSVRCAFEGAIAHIRATRLGLPLARLINPGCSLTVPVNASIGAADEGLEARVVEASGAGFRVLKVKVGLSAPDDEFRSLYAAASRLPPRGAFRLDANGAWDEALARDWLDRLAGLPVESIEEPLAGANPDSLGRLQRSVTFPLALDESLARYAAEGLLADPPVRRIVIKPTVAGGIRPARRLVEQAGAQVAFTTSLEAAPGRWLVAHLAAALGSDCHHGLDTGRWFASDLGAGPAIVDGECRLA